MKERQSNIELLRIITMLLIVVLHTNYFSLGEIGRDTIVSNPINSFIRMFTEQLCIVGVNVFVLISGWFGIKPSLKGALSILFQVVFYGALVLAIGLMLGVEISRGEIVEVFYFGSYYWFVMAYLGLYAISPVLNKFVEVASKKEQLIVLITFFCLEFLFGWFINKGTYERGYSIISFIGLYLLSRFIHQNSKYLVKLSSNGAFLLYLVFTLLPVFLAFFGQMYLGRGFAPIFYSSPFVIAASVFLLLAFSKMKIQSRCINWLAVSVFSIYLIHQHPIVVPYFKSLMQSAHNMMGEISYFFFTVVFAIVIGSICILIDKTRIAFWNLNCKLWLNQAISSFEGFFTKTLNRLGY